jgi:hypothetical protein
VWIFINQSDESFNGIQMLKQLRAAAPSNLGIFWHIGRNMPPGSSPGFQYATEGGICFYYILAEVKPSVVRAGSLSIPAFDAWGEHIRDEWIATGHPAQVKFDFGFNKGHGTLPSNWEDKNEQEAWDQLSGFIMAHEVLHVVHVRHSDVPGTIMYKKIGWRPLNLAVLPVDPSAAEQARRWLLQWLPDP